MLKTIALYLPQFHEVKENSLWWGKGYTDWVAARKAKPLYNGHYQPRVPLENNYYDLLQKTTLEWQASLAREYLIDGFCFYHYWFKDGKKILEKPAENLLKWKDIQLPFFFSWANESWARSWAAIPSVNEWAGSFENKTDKHGKAILLDEKYGLQDDWEKHFVYLLDFFKDSRYIKIDGKPVFMIHFADQMPCLHQMLKYWNKRAKDNGFNGIYSICPQYIGNESLVDATIPLANSTVWGLCSKKLDKSGACVISYDECWNKYSTLKSESHRTTLWCIQPDYDDSPRRGNKAILFSDSTPEKFKKYFHNLYQKSKESNNPFIFVNAWNEWGEGMYLEPDERYGFKYLESIRDVIQNNNDSELAIEKESITDEIDWIHGSPSQLNRLEKIDIIKTDIINFYISGSSFIDFFDKHNVSTICIYGFSELGELLYRALSKDGVNIKAILDKKVTSTNYDVAVINPDDYIPNCDMIVVTVLNTENDVIDYLESKTKAVVITLKSLLMECTSYD